MKDMSEQINAFTKDHTLITKGVLIIMMLMHHLFSSDMLNTFEVSQIVSNSTIYGHINTFCKMCVSGYAFLTAFGITKSLMEFQQQSTGSDYFPYVLRRLIKLETNLFFIFVLAIGYKRLVVHESIRSLYDIGNGFKVTYLILDMLGLATYFDTPTINATWWYMTYSILQVIAMPFIYLIYKRWRYLALLAGWLLAPMILWGAMSFSILLPSVLMGTAFAYEAWFDKIKLLGRRNQKVIRICVEVIIVCAAYFLCSNTDLRYCYGFAFIIPLLVFETIDPIPVLRCVLKFLGKHSTNIFLIHTFIYYYFYPYFIYSFKKDWLILLVTLAISTGVSIIIEILKKVFCYNYLVTKYILPLGQNSNS